MLAIVIGAAVAALLILRSPGPGSGAQSASGKGLAVLVATGPIRSGSLVRPGDLQWRELEAGPAPADSLVRGKVSEAQFVGAVASRDFAAGEVLLGGALIAASDRRFLAAVLSPGTGAVTLAVDAAQGGAGLILPDDRVDVVLVQDGAASPGAASDTRSAMSRILLHDVRVVAVDSDFDRSKPAVPSTSSHTITLQVADRDAQRLFLAEQMGKLQLTLRALAQPETALAQIDTPTLGSDVSPGRSAYVPAPRDRPSFLLGEPRLAGGGAIQADLGIHIVRGSKAQAQ